MTHFALIAVLALGLGASAYAADHDKPQRLTADQWCAKHDLPKDKCAECDKALIPKLKKDKDWCPEHACASSLCTECSRKDAKELLEALRPLPK